MNQFNAPNVPQPIRDDALLIACSKELTQHCSKSAIRRALGLLLHALGDRLEASATPALLAEQCALFPLPFPAIPDNPHLPPEYKKRLELLAVASSALPAEQATAALGPRWCDCIKGLGRTRQYCTAGCSHLEDCAR